MVSDKQTMRGDIPMSCYHHFTPKERESILIGLVEKKSIRAISKELARAPSSVSRELKRNYRSHEKCGYSPVYAQRKYDICKKQIHNNNKINQDATRKKVEELLQLYWSPEEISNRLKKEKNKIQISTSTIYRALNKGLLSRESFSCLRRKGNPHRSKKRKANCGCIPVDYSIHDRPLEANLRTQFGHWESDSVQGRKGGACIATHVERKSRFSVFLKLPKVGETKPFMQATTKVFENFPANFRRSFTVDHGKEFSGYRELMENLNCIVYFADPYCPNQRATNENTNGLLRQFVPKSFKIDDLTQQQIDAFAYLLNLRPRKCLGWRSPFEVFFKKVLHLT